MKTLQKRDIALLKCLRSNARLTLTQISRLTKIPISTLFDKLKSHENQTIIKHTTLVNFAKMGFPTKMQVLIKAPSTIRSSLQAYLQEHDHINSLYKVNNGFQFMAEGVFKHLADAELFVNSLEERFEQIECKMHYVLEDLKRERFFAS